jgi:acyl-CoA hydrolase
LAQLPRNLYRLHKFQIILNYPDIFALTCKRNDNRVPAPIPAFSAPNINRAIVMRPIPVLADVVATCFSQINAEVAAGVYVGAVGGQIDFIRGAQLAQGGRAVIALPATARDGKLSRIVTRLSGPVTTARSDADIIVTEFGAAELRGQPLDERVRRMIVIAHPDFRESLECDVAAA